MQISLPTLNDRVFNLHAKAHQVVAKKTNKGAFDLCKSFLYQIGQLLKEMKNKEAAMGMLKLCSPNAAIADNLIIAHNQLLFDAILLAKLFNKFADGFDFPYKKLTNDSQKVRLVKGNFFLPINPAEVEFLHIIETAQFEPSALIDDAELLQVFYQSEITKFTAPEKAAKQPNFEICSIIDKESKESINFAYNVRKNQILGVKELGYKSAADYLI
jgi:hypothetical protein